MRVSRMLFLLSGLLLVGLSPRPGVNAAQSADRDEKQVQAAGLKTDDAALVEFFRRRTLTDGDHEKVEKLIRQLGARAFRAREDAAAALVARGPVALELLKEGLKDADPEVVRRAGCCIQKIQEKDVPAEVAAAAARLLAARKPAGAAAALLGYLPVAENDAVAEEIRTGLAALAVRDGQADKALLAGLADRSPVRRGAAAEALTRAGAKDAQGAVRKVLADPVPEVRLRAATALAYARDKEAVPVLIALLESLPRPEVAQAEDVLYRLAEGQSAVPMVPLGDKAAERKKCRDAWDQWWAVHKDKADLARLGEMPRLLNYTLVVLLEENRVLEVDGKDKVLWQVGGLQKPLDVQLLPNGRLLMAEHEAQRVTERTLTGEVKWQYAVSGPIVAQRLANGHTFIATAQQLQELDDAGRLTFTFLPPNGERIMKAVKLANGEALCLVAPGGFNEQGPVRVLRVDADRKVVRSFPVNLTMHLSGGRIQGLANGNVVIPHCQENKVIEYDRDGKVVRELATEQPVVATRLPNGHTVVTSYTRERGAVEFDRNDRVVWQYKTGGSLVTRALRR